MQTTSMRLMPALLLLGCSASPAASDGARDAAILQPPGDQTLAIGDRIQVGGTGYVLEISSLKSDSRCPVDVACVWAGEFAVTGVLHADDGLDLPDVPVTLTTNDSTVAGGLSFRITAVEPAAHAGTVIPVDSYRFDLRVDPLGQPAN